MDTKVTLKENLSELQELAKERTVKTQNIEYDLETLVKKIQKGIIKLNPDYQRNHRWDNQESSKLIESLILNIPIPTIYLSQDVDVDEEVEDGVSMPLSEIILTEEKVKILELSFAILMLKAGMNQL